MIFKLYTQYIEKRKYTIIIIDVSRFNLKFSPPRQKFETFPMQMPTA